MVKAQSLRWRIQIYLFLSVMLNPLLQYNIWVVVKKWSICIYNHRQNIWQKEQKLSKIRHVFAYFFMATANNSFLKERLSKRLCANSIFGLLWFFPFLKNLSFKMFVNSSSNLYNKPSIVDINSRFTCGQWILLWKVNC